MQRKKLYLVDGNSYSYRAYYAIGDLRTKAGMPTGAVFGFVNMLNKLKRELSPDYLAVCFDLKGPTFRHKKFPDYKIHRKPMPEDLKVQMDITKQIITAYGIPIFQMQGFEADDIIATLAVKFKDKVDVFIVSGDKDMLQLVDKYVKIYNPQKDDAVIDAKSVFERYKVNPDQITDLLALTGDSSDNIPGVPGIGLKTAADLLGEFDNLENILKNKDKILKEKRKKLLEEFSGQSRLSKELATVLTDVPIKINLAQLKSNPEDTQTLRKLFGQLEFRHLYRSLVPDENKPDHSRKLAIRTISDKKQLAGLTKELLKLKEVSLDIAGSDNHRIASLAIGPDPRRIVNIVISRDLTIADLRQQLESFFNSNKILKIGYDLKKICVVLECNQIYLEGPFFDNMVAAYLLDSNTGTLPIQDIAARYLERDIEAARPASLHLALKQALVGHLAKNNIEDLFYKIEMPLVRVLASMEFEGICVDKKFLMSLGKKIDKKLDELTFKIYKISGCRFNINSPKQLSEVLFQRLKLPVIKKGKTGPSTNVEVLMNLSARHPLPALILEYRELAKLKSTYVDGMGVLIDPKTNRLHTSFNQTVTATGRLSSSAPNLQNIPARTEAGREIRAAFCSRSENWQFISADYSQIELRVLAHLSGDKQLTAAFKQGLDIHVFTAALIFGVDKDKVDKKMRDQAKRVNFGIVYGMGPHALARDIGVSFNEARNFIEAYFVRYPGVKTYLERQIKQAQTKGYVTTLLKRRRYIPEINSKNPMQNSFAQRTAMNTPIQGTAADLIKVAMVDIYQRFKQEGLKTIMVLQVHDELLFDAPRPELKKVSNIIKHVMENVLKLDVPIEVSLKTGSNWRDLKYVS